MKINDLIDSFDAMTPTQEEKEKMLSKILKAEEKKIVRIFDFKRVGMVAAGLVAAIALVVSVKNFGSVENPNNGTYVASVTESAESGQEEKTATIPKTEETKKTEIKKNNEPKKIEVASAKPVAEPKQERDIVVSEVPAAGSRVRIIENDADMQGASGGGSSAGGGVAVASEETENQGIAVASETDAESEGIAAASVENEENAEAEDEEEENKEEDEEENNE